MGDLVGVQFSPCRKFRYTLERSLTMVSPRAARICMFLMLNPSTADEKINDNTIRRTIDYGKRWAFDRLLVGNVYAFRSTDPRELWTAEDPVGPENDEWLVNMAALSEIVVLAFGANAKLARARQVLNLLKGFADLRYLSLTNAGVPGHPLYLKSELLPLKWMPGSLGE